MRSSVAKRMMAKIPKETKIFVDKYADIIIRVNQILEEKGMTQKELAERMGKKPSEVNRWLKQEHNLTLRSIAKLEAELNEPILYVPARRSFQFTSGLRGHVAVYTNDKKAEFETLKTTIDPTSEAPLSNVG
ncbi:MAG: helix-turn-helix transcriptional regulator [Tunicatimonas sp.]